MKVILNSQYRYFMHPWRVKNVCVMMASLVKVDALQDNVGLYHLAGKI